MKSVFSNRDCSQQSILHFAPEDFFKPFFQDRFGTVHTADLNARAVDFAIDIQAMPLDDSSYDVVFASHVLEHVPDDSSAIAEIRRILKPGGIAVLPVPIVAEKTVEYPEANPSDHFHVRAPGLDYFDRYSGAFASIEIITSEDLPAENQVFIFEDRSVYPSEKVPLRPGMSGLKHEEMVPICYV